MKFKIIKEVDSYEMFDEFANEMSDKAKHEVSLQLRKILRLSYKKWLMKTYGVKEEDASKFMKSVGKIDATWDW